MTIKKLGKMGAILGLCLSITIVSFVSGFDNDLVSAKATNQDSNNNNISFINQINDISLNLGSKTLLSNKELQELVSLGKISDIACTYDNSANKTYLYNIINYNSENYIQGKENYLLISDIKEDDIKKYIENIILDIINRALLDNRRKDDVHKLLSLKILIGNFSEQDQLGEYFENDNLIVISLNNILKNANTADDLYMSLYDTINHEFNHMFVVPCEDNKNNYKLPGEVGVSFLNEAAAESYNYNILKCDYKPVNKNFSFSYNNLEERKHESKLFLLSFLDNDKPLADYYEALFKGDMLKFCNYFNAYSDKEIEDLLSTIWLIDGRLVRNSYWSRLINSDDFSKLNDVNINEFLTDNTNGVIESYLLKNSVKQLMLYNMQKEVLSLDENLILYHFILVNILDSASFGNYDYTTHEVSYTFYNEFLKNYKIVEETFFDYLASIYDVSYNDIKEYYDSKDKSSWLSNISSYVKEAKVNGEDASKIANLVNKFPKIKNIVKGDTFLSNFNYNNLVIVTDGLVKNDSGFKFVLK